LLGYDFLNIGPDTTLKVEFKLNSIP